MKELYMKTTTYAQTKLPLNLNLVKGLSGSGNVLGLFYRFTASTNPYKR